MEHARRRKCNNKNGFYSGIKLLLDTASTLCETPVGFLYIVVRVVDPMCVWTTGKFSCLRLLFPLQHHGHHTQPPFFTIHYQLLMLRLCIYRKLYLFSSRIKIHCGDCIVLVFPTTLSPCVQPCGNPRNIFLLEVNCGLALLCMAAEFEIVRLPTYRYPAKSWIPTKLYFIQN